MKGQCHFSGGAREDNPSLFCSFWAGPGTQQLWNSEATGWKLLTLWVMVGLCPLDISDSKCWWATGWPLRWSDSCRRECGRGWAKVHMDLFILLRSCSKKLNLRVNVIFQVETVRKREWGSHTKCRLATQHLVLVTYSNTHLLVFKYTAAGQDKYHLNWL